MRYEQRFTAQESATKYAQEKSNEFRGSLDDIGKKQMPRTEAEAMFKAISEKAEAGAKTNAEKIDALQARMDRNEGRGGGFNSSWGYLIPCDSRNPLARRLLVARGRGLGTFESW